LTFGERLKLALDWIDIAIRMLKQASAERGEK
jgi:hypothetical protein